MRISTKGRYGTTAMLDLALHYGEGPVLVRDIARRQNISERYLEHLLISLKVAGMVRSTRGRRGGFTLAKPPAHVRLSEIIQAMEGSLAPADCVDSPQAYPQTALCAIYDLWAEMKTALDRILESTTLEALAERQKRKWSLKQSTGDTGDR
ncbi:MAG: Rrf2 family transcriptional regulator [Dehalococcoidia bacterium]|nr:Rrf2 family transcriptional regulator [Dehalococcoidia bacterium]